MLSKRLEKERFVDFMDECLGLDYEMCVSAFLSERHASHPGRPTDADAIVHNLVTNGFIIEAA